MGSRPLRGSFHPPGDKSISHRALLLAGLATGESVLEGLNPGADCRSTRSVLEALGVRITDLPDGRCLVTGSGGRFAASDNELDAGNSGTTIRLMAGVAAALPGTRRFTGDASLRRRPMDRVATPLGLMGARFTLTEGRFAPFAVAGGGLRPIEYRLPVPSAQVKSAVLLAGALSEGTTAVLEPVPTRDHTERMLRAFGVPVARVAGPGGTPRVAVVGPAELSGCPYRVPGDISAAVFLLVAGLLVPGSRVTAIGVGVNPTRRAALDILARMGARLVERGGARADAAPDLEPVADIEAGESELTAADISGAEAAVAIDELPILAIAAACATGTTRIRDAVELRVKESDRIAALAAGLAALGVRVQEHPDGLDIVGGGPGFRFEGGAVAAHHDHRIAMAFAVAGLVSRGPVVTDGGESAAISDPRFAATLASLQGVSDTEAPGGRA